MNHFRHQLFACPAFALEEYGCIATDDTSDGFVHLLHGRAAADDLLIAALDGRQWTFGIGREPFDFYDVGDQSVDIIEVERFWQIVKGSTLHRLDRIGQRGLTGDNDDREVDLSGLRLL